MGADSDNAIEHSCSLIHFTSRCFLARFSFSSPDLVRDILSSSGSLLFLIWFDSLGPINQLFVVLIFITSNRKEIMNYLQNVSLSLEWINIWEERFAERCLFFFCLCKMRTQFPCANIDISSAKQQADCGLRPIGHRAVTAVQSETACWHRCPSHSGPTAHLRTEIFYDQTSQSIQIIPSS